MSLRALGDSIKAVTREFTAQKRKAAAADRDTISAAQYERLLKQQNDQQLKEAAYEALPDAYAMASDNGELPANARQLYYAVRPAVIADCRKSWANSATFTQGVLNDFIREHPDQTADWDVVYDARGHFAEPHVIRSLGIGTIEVRSYLSSWNETIDDSPVFKLADLGIYPTRGPLNRYRYALFIEKEGFEPLLKRSRIAEKFDLAIFSSKGMSTTAARQLVEALSEAGVTILVAHDFDLSGLTIAHTLGHDTRRYQFAAEPNVIDIGLRLKDIEELGLQSEDVAIEQVNNPLHRFDDYFDDAPTVAEEKFLISASRPGYRKNTWLGQRVELNAMTSRQFIDWLEAKLAALGSTKVVPARETLAAAWQRARRLARIGQAVAEIQSEAGDDLKPAPKNLSARVRAKLKEEPELSWDEALVKIVEESLSSV